MVVIVDDFRRNFMEMLEKQGRGSRASLAKHLGVSPAYITQLANGDRDPNLRTLEEIAAFFDVHVSRLLRQPKKKSA